MRLLTSIEFCDAFECSRDDTNNIIKHVFSDWMEFQQPSGRQPRLLTDREATLLGVARELRCVGISTGGVRAIIKGLHLQLNRPGAEWLVARADEQAAEVWTAALIKTHSAEDLLAQYGGRSMVLVPIKLIKIKVAEAVAKAGSRLGVDPKVPMPPKLSQAEIKAQRDAAIARNKKARVS